MVVALPVEGEAVAPVGDRPQRALPVDGGWEGRENNLIVFLKNIRQSQWRTERKKAEI